MATSVTKLHTNAARGSQARASVELANAVALAALSRALTAAGCATGTTTSKAQIVNTLTYTIAGKFYSKATADDFWTLSGAVVAASRFQKYLLLIDTAGAASVQEGTAALTAATVSWGNVSAVSAWAPIISVLGTTKAIVGVLTVATDATHTFTPGTTLLGAAGITATYVDGLDQSILPIIANEAGTIVGNGG